MTIYLYMMLMLCSLSLAFSNSSMFIISIISTTIMGSMFIVFNYNIIWLSYMIMMLMVGGLMILYIFILSMNSNEKVKEKKSLSYIPIIILSSFIFFKDKPSSTKTLSNSIFFQNSTYVIFFIMIFILMTMFLTSKMIYNPCSPSKSLK